MNTKLVVRFDTDLGKRFTMSFNNPKADLTTEIVQGELQKIIDSDILAPSQGKPISIYSAELVETNITNLI